MTTLNISLPESLREYVDAKVAQGAYETPSDYIRQLIHEDQSRADRQRIDALLIEGLESGEPIEINDQWWEKKEAELLNALERDHRS